MKALQKMKTWSCFFLLFFSVSFAVSGCSQKNYQVISQEKAKEMMQKEPDCMVVDVRTEKEYEKKHILNAVLVPIEDIRAGKLDALPDKKQILLLYCRTGRRAEESAEILAEQGYLNVYSFGGILEWTGEVAAGK